MRENTQRPDGRIAPGDVARLRNATRALRLHIDELPIDYRLGALPQRFLTGLAFASARQRFDCVESLIGAGFGGTAMGAMSRGLLVDALKWWWIASDAPREAGLLAELLRERDGICETLGSTGSTCGALNRWLQPLPNIAGLTGQAQGWARLEPLPSDNDLLAEYLEGRLNPVVSARPQSQQLMERMHELLSSAELYGTTMILAHSGHGNYLGLLSSVAEAGGVGFDLRFDHEALFMQAAAIGVVGTLVGSSVPDGVWWPQEVPKAAFINTALDLAHNVSTAATAVHKLVGRPNSRATGGRKRSTASRRNGPFAPDPRATPKTSALLPDVASVEPVWDAVQEYAELVGRFKVDPWAPNQTFHAVLSYGAAISNFQSLLTVNNQPGASIILPFVARLMLEEAARTRWRYATQDVPTFEKQATQFFDEYRARRKKTIDQLITSGVSRAAAERFFALPEYVDQSRVPSTASRGRVPLPPVAQMLGMLGQSFPEPGWLKVAYSALSQVTHMTPLGLLHSVRFRNGALRFGTLSPEMTALSLDVACIASAEILGTFGLVLSDLSEGAFEWRRDLVRGSAKVHNLSRLVHGLD
ncbi:hypothetical protein [Agromyces cerinus]|nr:hypothetical protein [Agromyces cerinus]